MQFLPDEDEAAEPDQFSELPVRRRSVLDPAIPEQERAMDQGVVRDHWPTRELKLQAELARADEAAIKWHRKYEEIFQEQCQFRSVETQLRERLRIAEAAAAVKDAQWDVIEWLLKRLQEGSSAPLPR